MAAPVIIAKVAMALANKESRGLLKTVLLFILGVIIFASVALFGLFYSINSYLSGTDDIYNHAKEAVKVELSIENDLNVAILRIIDLMTDTKRTNQTELEAYIKEYFITKESNETPPEENTENENSGNGETPPEIQEVTRFKNFDEIMEILRDPPFSFSDKDIEEIKKLISSGGGQGTGGGAFAWPVPGYNNVTSPFGYRTHPVTGAVGKFHSGMDIGAPMGTPVIASASGTVIFSGWNGGYGYYVQIDHGDGVITCYGHNSSLIANVGDVVEQGQTIALIGSTGVSTGAHCHFEVKINGEFKNPADYV